MNNIPEVKLGIVAVSRDCFPIELSQKRRAAIVEACRGGLYECPVTVENEQDMLSAVADVTAAGCNALVVFLGNFGPETPETLIAKHFDVDVREFLWHQNNCFTNMVFALVFYLCSKNRKNGNKQECTHKIQAFRHAPVRPSSLL